MSVYDGGTTVCMTWKRWQMIDSDDLSQNSDPRLTAWGIDSHSDNQQLGEKQQQWSNFFTSLSLICVFSTVHSHIIAKEQKWRTAHLSMIKASKCCQLDCDVAELKDRYNFPISKPCPLSITCNYTRQCIKRFKFLMSIT